MCQKGALPPLDSPVISVSRIQNRPCRFYILTPEIKEAPSPSSKGMLTVLLYNYPKVAFLQYCVSVGCGVVSLTKGTSIKNSWYNLSFIMLIRGEAIRKFIMIGMAVFTSETSYHQTLLTSAFFPSDTYAWIPVGKNPLTSGTYMAGHTALNKKHLNSPWGLTYSLI